MKTKEKKTKEKKEMVIIFKEVVDSLFDFGVLLTKLIAFFYLYRPYPLNTHTPLAPVRPPRDA